MQVGHIRPLDSPTAEAVPGIELHRWSAEPWELRFVLRPRDVDRRRGCFWTDGNGFRKLRWWVKWESGKLGGGARHGSASSVHVRRARWTARGRRVATRRKYGPLLVGRAVESSRVRRFRHQGAGRGNASAAPQNVLLGSRYQRRPRRDRVLNAAAASAWFAGSTHSVGQMLLSDDTDNLVHYTILLVALKDVPLQQTDIFSCALEPRQHRHCCGHRQQTRAISAYGLEQHFLIFITTLLFSAYYTAPSFLC
jgi:hypothetical protein